MLVFCNTPDESQRSLIFTVSELALHSDNTFLENDYSQLSCLA